MMKTKTTLLYEILIVDRNGQSEIESNKSVVLGLAYSDKLWSDPQIKNVAKKSSIEDKKLGIHLQVEKIENSGHSNQPAAAFLITVSGQQYEKLEPFREALLHHVKDKLQFTDIQILHDGISDEISEEVNTIVHELELGVRNHIIDLHNQDIDSWEQELPAGVVKRVKARQSNNPYASYANVGVAYIDFEDMTEVLIAANNTSLLKDWKVLIDLREKVSYHALFGSKDLEAARKIEKSISSVIGKTNLKSVKPVSAKANEKKSIAKKTSAKPKAKSTAASKIKTQTKQKLASKPVVKAETIKEENKEVSEKNASTSIKATAPKPKPEPAKKPESTKVSVGFEMITEGVLLEELKKAEQESVTAFIDLKAFVTETLSPKGYSTGPAYSIAKNMDQKGVLKIYDTKDDKGFTVKAVKSV